MGASNNETELCDEEQAFLPTSENGDSSLEPQKPRYNVMPWLRLGIDAAMFIALIFLVLNRPQCGLIVSPVPRFPERTYTFTQNPRYAHDGMFNSSTETLHTLHNWIELSSASRGYVQIPNADQFDLPTPHIVAIDRNSDGPAYMVSAFHQLHCLSYLVEHYQTSLTEEVAHHTGHCVDYLRQSILCSADTSLEGKSEFGPGWGSQHQCKDWDALLEWANNNSAYKWRGALLPDTSVL